MSLASSMKHALPLVTLALLRSREAEGPCASPSRPLSHPLHLSWMCSSCLVQAQELRVAGTSADGSDAYKLQPHVQHASHGAHHARSDHSHSVLFYCTRDATQLRCLATHTMPPRAARRAAQEVPRSTQGPGTSERPQAVRDTGVVCFLGLGLALRLELELGCCTLLSGERGLGGRTARASACAL